MSKFQIFLIVKIKLNKTKNVGLKLVFISDHNLIVRNKKCLEFKFLRLKLQ